MARVSSTVAQGAPVLAGGEEVAVDRRLAGHDRARGGDPRDRLRATREQRPPSGRVACAGGTTRAPSGERRRWRAGHPDTRSRRDRATVTAPPHLAGHPPAV